jgi:hypothetical protein
MIHETTGISTTIEILSGRFKTPPLKAPSQLKVMPFTT